MFRSFIALAGFACLGFAPPVTAETTDPHLEKGQFCTQQKAAVDRRASEESAAIFASLHACSTFCTEAGHLKSTESERRIDALVNRCETAFAALPSEMQSRFGAAPDAGDTAAASSMRRMAQECQNLAIQYPRLANDRRDPSFNKCATSCESAADRIDEAGYDVANYTQACEQEYNGAKARIATLRRN